MVQLKEATRIDLLVHTLKAAACDHGPAVFSTGLSVEDMVITDAILTAGVDIAIVMIAAKPLHAAELDHLERIRGRYGYEIRVYTPHAPALTDNDALYSLNLVDPLQRALHGRNAWITGQRQAIAARHTVSPYEYDARHGVLRFNPLVGWSDAQVCDYLAEKRIPCHSAGTALAA